MTTTETAPAGLVGAIHTATGAGAAPRARHWIDGGLRDSEAHKRSVDPATGEVNGQYAVGGTAEAREAVDAAVRAFRETAWKVDRGLRGRVFQELAARFEERAPELIRMISRETGKVTPKAAFEMWVVALGLWYHAGLALTSCGRTAKWAPGRVSLLVEAVALANDSEYGLAASVFTRDADRPLRIARDLQAGTVLVNDWAVVTNEFEEGGYKQSGRGRLRGPGGLEDLLEYKQVVLRPGVVAAEAAGPDQRGRRV